MKIRRMIESDVAPVVEMIKRNWDEVLVNHHREETVKRFRPEVTCDAYLKSLSWKEIYVVEDDGRIIATGSLADFGTPETPRMSVSMFFVSPDCHRRGVGRMLIEHLFSSALSQNIKKIHVPSSKNAVRFYERFGFAIDVIQHDEANEITWMTKDINKE